MTVSCRYALLIFALAGAFCSVTYVLAHGRDREFNADKEKICAYSCTPHPVVSADDLNACICDMTKELR